MGAPENPPAFPIVLTPGYEFADNGMTLRDWFAGHGDQPGVSEIVSMAGHTSDGFWVFREGFEKTNFNEWWNSLPLSERLALSARVRFAQADAMLAARQSQEPPHEG